MLSMQKLKDMTDAELIRHLKESGIAHGPIVESTRTLYEKKLFEYERKKKSFPNSAESSYESKQEYSSREYDANQGDYKTYEEEKYTKTYNYPQAHQRVKDDGRSKTGDKYQHISQGRHQSSYSQGVEARRPIRPLSREPESLQQPKRYIPLWLQMVVLLLFTGCLVFLYFRETKQNPFKFLQEILRRKK